MIIVSSDLDMTEEEEIISQVVVRVWRLSRIWWIVFLFPVLGSLPYVQQYPFIIVIGVLALLWLSTYLVRQRWRLTLTNRQIVARQLYPRPLTALSKVFYFPINKIEGLSVGPRAFRSILLVGVFIATNLGVTLLKSGLSSRANIGYDLPDSIDALILILNGITFLPILGQLANAIEDVFGTVFSFADDVLIGMGITFIILGVITVLLTIPRRYHLQIRVRHGADFKLAAGIPRSFWEKCYEQMYQEKTVSSPKEFSRWRFPWLKDEQIQTVADLDEVIYINRFIGLFAIYAGTLRIWNRVQARTLGDDVLLWMVVAATDVFIAIVAVVFSKKKNEMAVTNRRIIFAQEMQDISGAFGRRLYLMSDIGRDDVAGFRVHRTRKISYLYLVLTIALTLVTIIFWTTLELLFIKLVFVILVVVFASFIVQTYLEFNLKTKGNELWHMRHQLSNPVTLVRQVLGNDENLILTTLLSNRLEEKEIVDTMQIIRAVDLDLTPKLFGDTKYFGDRFEPSGRENRHVELEDLLLEQESVKYEANVSRGVPNRSVNLGIASVIMLLFSLILYLPLLLSEEIDIAIPYQQLFSFLPLVVTLILIAVIWIRYYSLFRARILFTDHRAFFTDTRKPPLLLYLLGIAEQETIEETLQGQIHSTYSSRQISQQQYWRDFIYHGSRLILHSILFGVILAFLLSVYEPQNRVTDQYPVFVQLFPVIIFCFYIISIGMVWHVGNLYIAFIRSIPKRVVHTRGVGSHFIVPFSSIEKADQISTTVWEGIISGEST